MTEPMYRQIAEDLRDKVESGTLSPGEQLPTETQLMRRYRASRNTVRDAIKLLATRRLVETRPGQGTFVTPKIDPFVTTLTGPPGSDPGSGEGEQAVYIAEVTASGRQPAFSEPSVGVRKAVGPVADALRLTEGADVVSRHQRCFIDDTPWALQTSFYPMSLIERGATRLLQAAIIPQGTVSYLREALGIRQVGYRDSIAVRAPDEEETLFFRLPADGRIPVFETLRVAFDNGGQRIRLTIAVYPSDRNRFEVNVGRVPPRNGEIPGP